jgi:hypothetical protein
MRIIFNIFILSISLKELIMQCPDLSGNPVNATDCSSKSDDSNFCCMLSSPGYNPSDTKCYKLSKDNYVGQNSIVIGGSSWRMNCDNAKPTVKESAACGNSNPLSASDCWYSSTLDNSCCYYNVTKTCQWSVAKKTGIVTKDNNITLNCSQNFLTISYILILYFSFIILGDI